jgi:glycogen synthase
MNGHDAFLFPTKYEGFPIALIEAMASGCVPVVSRLAGITDCIIVGGVNGFLFPIGNVRQATLHLLELLSDKSLLTEMRNNAKEEVKGYGLSQMGERYYKLICDIQAVPRQIRQPEHLGKYKLASGLKPAWWYGLPDPIKNHLRIIREKMRASMQLP